MPSRADQGIPIGSGSGVLPDPPAALIAVKVAGGMVITGDEGVPDPSPGDGKRSQAPIEKASVRIMIRELIVNRENFIRFDNGGWPDNNPIVTKSKVPEGTLLDLFLPLRQLLEEIPGIDLGAVVNHLKVQVRAG
jgi:hypothetical protein